MRAAVLGHPIAHSLSPLLHRAAYAALDVDWDYEAIDMVEADLASFVASRDDAWAGLSLTMPLKLAALQVADSVEPQAKLVGAANTLVASGKGEYRRWVAANTDIHGIVAALREAGVTSASSAVILGGGATATSALAALAQLGATAPVVAVRSRARAAGLMRAASRMGLGLRFTDIGGSETLDALRRAMVTVSTVPAAAGDEIAGRLAQSETSLNGALLDVVYSPLDTPLAQGWRAAGGRTVGGHRMLLHQAGAQVKLMTGHEPPMAAMGTALDQALASEG